MFNATMSSAICGATTLAQLDGLSRQVWQAHGSGAVTEDEAQGLAEAIHHRRAEVRETITPVGIPLGKVTLFPPKRRHPASPDKLASRDRRRFLACSGPMPPTLACRFTTGQLAVLRIVGDEVARNGTCALPIDAVAARAGVCRRLAQAAIRLAEGDGLLTIQERRHQGRKNDPNVVRIISREWLAWLRRGGRSAAPALVGSTGCKPLHPTDTGEHSNTVETAGKRGKGYREGDRPGPLRQDRAPLRYGGR